MTEIIYFSQILIQIHPNRTRHTQKITFQRNIDNSKADIFHLSLQNFDILTSLFHSQVKYVMSFNIFKNDSYAWRHNGRGGGGIFLKFFMPHRYVARSYKLKL